MLKRGEPEYKSAYQNDMTFNAITENANTCRLNMELKQHNNKSTTFSHRGYSNVNHCLLEKLLNKHGITNSMQIKVLNDTSCCQLQVYVHWHKLYEMKGGIM